MNCDAARRRLLSADRPDRPADDVAAISTAARPVV